jgi:hypothetical protein
LVFRDGVERELGEFSFRRLLALLVVVRLRRCASRLGDAVAVFGNLRDAVVEDFVGWNGVAFCVLRKRSSFCLLAWAVSMVRIALNAIWCA